MPTQQETLIILKMKDEVTRQMKVIGDDVRKQLKDISDSYVDTSGKVRQHGQEVGKLKEFYKEQRAENRLMSFYFREGREAVNALSFGILGLIATTGEGDKTQQKFNKSLAEGFAAFQGIEFMLSSMGAGPWGLLAGGIAGSAIAFKGFSESAKMSKEQMTALNDITKAYYEGISGKYLDDALKANERQVASLENLKAKKQEELKIATAAGEGFDSNAAKAGKAIRQEIADIDRLIASYMPWRDQLRLLSEAEAQQLEVQQRISGQAKEDGKSAYETWVRLGAVIPKADKSLRDIIPTINQTTQAIRVQIPPAKELAGTYENAGEKLKNYHVIIGVADSAAGIFAQNIIEGNKNISESYEAMASFVIQQLEMILIKESLLSIFGMSSLALGATAGATGSIFTMLGAMLFHQGGTVPKAHNGMFVNAPASKEFPIIVRGGETIRTESQERSIQHRLRGGNGGGTNIYHFHFNAPVTDEQFVMNAVMKTLRKAGRPIDEVYVDSSSTLALG